jgi:rhodanese-related sulfurtransferase
MYKIRNLSFVFLLLALTARSQHPFKFDNTIYKAVYWLEVFSMMDTLQNYLLLDVRSPGEYADTSRATALNIGRIRKSVNITIDSVPAHLDELRKYMNVPVFIYCSHSQRSRRVSKLLAENGFKQVYNINGGMTSLNEQDASQLPEKSKWFVSNLSYQNISSGDAYRLIKNTPGLVIIDIRTAAAFASQDSLLQNDIGHIKNAINIPQNQFAEKLDALHIPAGSPVLVYDLNGINSMDVVDMLRAKGFTRIYNLFDGLSGFMRDHAFNQTQFNELFTGAPGYHMLDVEGSIRLLSENPGLIILDTRPAEEFNNKAGMSHANLGRIRGAIHISTTVSLDEIIKDKKPSAIFLVYGSGSDLAVVVCNKLLEKGFHQVYYLSPGLYQFVWATANVEDCRKGRAFLTDHEGLY